ncbi:NAD-dependent epimerase/dehydratase family protein [Rhodovibrionaceae bacterium A322]
MKRILVTGAGGYIGSTLVPMLLAEGYEVRAIDRFFFGREMLENHDRLEFIQEDCRKLRPEHFEGVDGVIDLVAISNDPSGELFQEPTMQINWQSRAKTAKMAKEAGATRYVLPSSCSIYGFQDPDFIADETSATNPLTTYAKANEKAEHDTLPLADENFCVVVLRQSTVYGLAPRMRFDLAINGMTFGAWKTGKLPLMRDGKQWRPMVHVRDTARAQMFMLTAPADKVNGQLFNVGSAENVYQLGPLGELVANEVPRDVAVEWYGDVDHRSYRVSFDKIEALGYKAELTAEDGVREICEALDAGTLDKNDKTITLEWYKNLASWLDQVQQSGEVSAEERRIVEETVMYDGMLKI